MFGINSKNGYQKIADGILIKTINYGGNMLMAEFLLEKGAVLPAHSHIYEQTGYLIKGRIQLFINENTKELMPGDNWNIPKDIKHKALILEDSKAIEVFNPVREDYLKYINKEDIQ